MRVKALLDCFIDNHYRKEGTEFEYSGAPIPDLLEPVGVDHEDSAEEAPKLRKRTAKAAASE